MDKIRIRGGKPLNGQITDQRRQERGPAADGRGPAHRRDGHLAANVPHLADIDTMAHLLVQLGVEVASARRAEREILRSSPPTIRDTTAPYDLVRKMRASVAGAGAAAGARRPGQGLAARAAAPSARGRSTCTSRGWRPRRRDRAATRAMFSARAPKGLQGRRDRVPQRLGRRHREPADGGGAGRGRDGADATPRASPRSAISPTA